ncbi:phosphoglycerate dehydrogenase-like oxidoreductase [Bradyrhizobium sp. YR681]|uniref:NAD(P)-dependent oxidoreductase n=1 Tax=Bradyrhizobium sp. YR681 TaxID=1144344 RepID=UPI0002711BB4|nr:NAD(P)-dependent oxidoreductase [Bradyrhizobium sp. YR681]EJN13530.1 phosphoglycerate dehydrogenase-like oxidoreductase [Bradyrhizobium sp. YR681]
MSVALVVGSMAIGWIDKLTEATSGAWRFLPFDPAQPNPAVVDFEALITPSYRSGWPAPPTLRLIQVPLVGIDQIDLGAVPSTVMICNVTGHDVAVAEYVIMTMLAAARNLLHIVADFGMGSWGMGSRAGGPLRRELSGATLGIIGCGGIGRAIAKRASALGMRVVGCNRTLGPPPPGVAELRPLADIAEIVAEADYIVVAIALTDETRGLIGARVLGRAQRSAVLINVARGECVDEAALFDACREQRLGGAVLDVWYRYPTPSDPAPPPSRFAFHSLPNVVMTPHISAWTTGTVDRRIQQIADNLIRLRRAEPLLFCIRSGGMPAGAEAGG